MAQAKGSAAQLILYPPMAWRDLASRVWADMLRDRCFGRAAELAFFLVLSFFPLLICLLSVLTFIPQSEKVIFQYLSGLMPDEAMSVMKRWIGELFSQRNRGLFSFSLVFALWSASTGMAALMDVLNVSYDVEEGRSFWKGRLVALLLVFALLSLILGGSTLVVFGDDALWWAKNKVDVPAPMRLIYSAGIYVVGIALLFSGFVIVYHFAPNVRHRSRWMLTGAIFATIATIAVSQLFSVYLRYAPSFHLTYGSLGAFVVLMLWVYLVSIVIIVGSEVNSELEKASGRPAEQKVKKK